MLARIALRKHKLPLGHEVRLAKALAACKSWNVPDLGISADDIRNALESRQEVSQSTIAISTVHSIFVNF